MIAGARSAAAVSPFRCAGWPSSWLPCMAAALLSSACSLAPLHLRAAERPLLSPASLGGTHGALQGVVLALDGQDAQFQCVVTVDPQSLTLIGLSAQGHRLFSLRDDGQAVSVELGPDAPAGLDPRRVLRDLQLALWPLAALQAAMAGTDWTVSEPAPSTRRLRRAQRLVAEVHYRDADPWQGTLWVSDFEQGYSVTIDSRSLP